MNKLVKYSLAILCTVFAFGLISCSSDDDYSWAEVETSGAYFLDTDEDLMFLPGQSQQIALTVQRKDSTQAGSVKLTTDNSKFSVPAEVSFAANEKSKVVYVTSDLPSGSQETVTVSVAESDAYTYGLHTLTFNVTTPLKYTGMFVSNAFEGSWEQDIYEIGDGSYILPSLYTEGSDITFVVDWSTKKITVSQQAAWVSGSYGQAYVSGSGTYDATTKVATLSLKHFVSDGSFGTFKEYFYFPEDFEPAK